MSSHGWSISDDDSDDASLLPQPKSSLKRNRDGQPSRKEFASPAHIKKRAEENVTIPSCPYGEKCYRNNPEHFKEFKHPPKQEVAECTTETAAKRKKITKGSRDPQIVWHESSPLNFLLTTVSGIPDEHNYHNESSQLCSLHIRDILSEDFGDLIETVQFNYCINPTWFMEQLPNSKRNIPVIFVHGENGMDHAELRNAKGIYGNIKSCRIDLPPFGTHHTKMMFLQYDAGIRIIIHTANLVDRDWHQKTQGMWLSPLFLPNKEDTKTETRKPFSFKDDLLEYIATYSKPDLARWSDIIKSHDLSAANVVLVGSVPGRHKGAAMHKWGHPKLAKALSTCVKTDIANWPVIGQFSSIGSLGADKDKWVCGEWLRSLSAVGKSMSGLGKQQKPPLKLIFPSEDDVRTSLEGYPAGASVPYSFSVAKKQPWLTAFLHRWKANHLGRSYASPHIKSYTRVSKDFSEAAWFLLTSANLSKAAWGSFEKKETQLAIRSYELGVLFLPQRFFSSTDVFLLKNSNAGAANLTLPFATPLVPYSSRDDPWIWDIAHKRLPDRHGNMWCPS